MPYPDYREEVKDTLLRIEQLLIKLLEKKEEDKCQK
jgi:hypothetical protein